MRFSIAMLLACWWFDRVRVLILVNFSRHEPSESPLKPFLLLGPDQDKGVDADFLNEAVKRFDEDENIKPAFISAVESMSQELAEMNIDDDYKPYMTVCSRSISQPIVLY